MERKSTRTAAYVVLSLGILLILYLVIKNLAAIWLVTSPFFGAFALSYAAEPLVTWLERGRINRVWGMLIFYLILLVVLGLISWWLAPAFIDNARDFIGNMPEYSASIAAFLEGFRARFSGMPFVAMLEPVLNQVFTAAQAFSYNAIHALIGSVGNVASVIARFFIAIILSFYFTRDKDAIGRGLLKLLPEKWRLGAISIAREMNDIVMGFIRSQLIIALILGLSTTLALLAFGVRYAVVLGILAGLLDIIPYLGAPAALLPITLIMLIDMPERYLWFLLVYIIIQQIENSIISPKISGDGVGLHPVLAILAVLMGGMWFGFMGLLLSIPVFAMLCAICRRVYRAIV